LNYVETNWRRPVYNYRYVARSENKVVFFHVTGHDMRRRKSTFTTRPDFVTIRALFGPRPRFWTLCWGGWCGDTLNVDIVLRFSQIFRLSIPVVFR